MTMNIVTGNDAGTTLSGTAGSDLIYGFDPNAAYASATITATRVVSSGLSLPIAVTSAPGDLNRLFVVEKYGTIKIVDLNSGEVLATSFLTVPVDNTFVRARAARSRLRSELCQQRAVLRLPHLADPGE